MISTELSAFLKKYPVRLNESADPTKLPVARIPVAKALYWSENHLLTIIAWENPKKGAAADWNTIPTSIGQN